MKIVFLGNTLYSLEILDELIKKGYAPELVVTEPDKPRGRGLKKQPTPVKNYCLENRVDFLTPEFLMESSFISRIKEIQPDLYIVVAYGRIIPEELLSLARIMGLCIHPSLLPRYRGAAPVNWVLINGESKTGVTLFKMDKGIDSGPIIAQESIKISNQDDYLSLFSKIYLLSKKMVIKVLSQIENQNYTFKPQDEKKASYAPRVDKDLAHIDWSKPAPQIKNLVRALIPYPCAWSFFRDKRVKFWKVDIIEREEDGFSSGQIVNVEKGRVLVKTSEGLIQIEKIQPEAKKTMDIASFINGYHPQPGEKFY